MLTVKVEEKLQLSQLFDYLSSCMDDLKDLANFNQKEDGLILTTKDSELFFYEQLRK